MSKIDFTESLNANQKDAVLWNEGPLLVLAGPGSGKTKVLTHRAARLLREDNDASILALTFTLKAAEEMSERLARLLGERTDRAQLCTFHSFSADLLRQHGSHIQIKPDFTIVNSIEDRIVFVEESLKALKASGEINIQLIPDDRKNIIMLLEKLFSSSYREEYSIELAKKVSWLPAFFKSYTNALRVNNCLDFGALLYFAQELLILNPNVAELVRLGWQYVCIDEFQDTNRIQYDILKLIVPEKDGNLFVVADDDQIIYQWNGASPERLLSLQNEYEMSVVQLPENYRCPSEIIDMANLIISHNKTRAPNKFPLLSKKDPSASSVIVAISYGTEDEEVQDIPRYILNNRWDPEECVVLARTGRLLEKAANALQANQIAAYIAKRKNEFESPAALWMYSIMRFALSRGSHDILRKICNSWQRLTNISIDIDEVETQAEADLGDYFRVWVEVALKETPSLKTDYIHILKKIQNGLVERNDYCGVLRDFLELKFLDDDLEQEELATWRELHECLQAEFSQTITLSQYMQEMELRSKSSPSPPNAVRCMTVHGAKGLEFKHVFLIGMADGVFPSFQAVNKGDRSKEMEEERRNCFVAITRVKETLNISFSSSYNGYRKNPSRFLEEMGFKVGD